MCAAVVPEPKGTGTAAEDGSAVVRVSSSARQSNKAMADMNVLRNILQEQREAEASENNELVKRMTMCFSHFHPESKPRILWDLWLLVMIFYCAIMVPLDLGLGGFDSDAFDNMNIVILVAFSVDMCLNFNTAYFNSDGNLETRHSRIIAKYLKGWFLLDFFSTFPFDLILSGMGGTANDASSEGQMLIRLPRIIKAVRLARIMRLAKAQQVIERSVGLHLLTNVYFTLLVRFVTLFLALLLIAHWAACGFCALAEYPEDPAIADDMFEGEQKVGWAYQGVNAMDMSKGQRYRAAYYLAFSILTMAKPTDVAFLTSYCGYYFQLFGFIKPLVAASIMGVLTNMIVKQNSRKGQLLQKKHTIGQFMQQNKVDTNTVHQVMAYIDHADAQIRSSQEVEAIKSLSPTLRDELAYQTMHQQVNKFSLFHQEFGTSMVRALCPVLKQVHYGPDDLVYQAGHLMQSMVFVLSGTLKQFRKVQAASGQAAAEDAITMEEGREVTSCPFGAHAIFCESDQRRRIATSRSATVLCYTFCELTFLTRTDFQKVVAQNPAWSATYDHIQAVLKDLDHESEVVQELIYGNSGPLEQVLAQSDMKATRGWNKLKATVVNMRLLRLTNKTPEAAGETGIQSGNASSEHTNHQFASGFHSMELNAKDRHMMEQLATVSTQQGQMAQRQTEMQSRIENVESMVKEMHKMLKNLSVTPSTPAPALYQTNHNRNRSDHHSNTDCSHIEDSTSKNEAKTGKAEWTEVLVTDVGDMIEGSGLTGDQMSPSTSSIICQAQTRSKVQAWSSGEPNL